MKTTATNRRVRELLTGIRDGTLIPRPEFQRRLVWSNKDRISFIETVILGYPFPEIYVAAGDVDLESGEANEMLVDGQQRVTTLNQYFTGAPDLKLSAKLKPYSGLSKSEKEQFLQYEVVVRDLGKLSIEDIRQVFPANQRDPLRTERYGDSQCEVRGSVQGVRRGACARAVLRETQDLQPC